MPAVASITIIVDDQGAVQAMNNVTRATEKLTPAFEKAGQRGNVVLTRMQKDHEKARDAVQLLSNTIGVHVPRSLEKVIARLPGVSSALIAAFEITAIVAFTAQIGRLISDLDAAKVTLSQWNQVGQVMIGHLREMVGLEANLALERQRWLKQRELFLPIIETQRKLEQQAAAITLGGLAAIEQKRKAAKDDILQAETAQLLAAEKVFAATEQYERAKVNITEASNHARVAADRVAAAERIVHQRSVFDATRQFENQAFLSGSAGIEAISRVRDQAVYEEKLRLERGLIDKQAFEDRKTAIEKKATDDRKELERQRLEEITQLESEAAIASLPPWQRANAQIIADAERRIREIEALMAKDKNFQDEGAREIAAVWKKTFAEMRDSLANELESLFDDITSGNIGRRFLNAFKKLVFVMIATWIMGMRGLKAASQGSMGSGGGILGAIFGSLGLGGLGAIFGGGIGPGGTPPFFGPLPLGNTAERVAALGSLTAMPLSAGGGGLAGSILPAGSAAGSAAQTAGFFKHNFGKVPASLVAMAGLTLAGAGAGMGSVGGTLLSVAGGALTGFAVGAQIGAIGGPIGMAIGAIIGGLVGLFGIGKKRKQRRQLEDQLTLAVKQVQDAYDFHQTDYSSAMDQLEQLRQQYAEAQRKVGGDVNQRVNRHVNETEEHIRTIEAERQRRSGLVFGPAQFRKGGYVSAGLAAGPGGMAAFRAQAGGPLMQFGGGGAVPAVLHPGEFVVRPEAVRSIGVGNLQRMNAGGGSGGDIHVTIKAIDARSFAEWLRTGGMKTLVNEIRRAQDEGAI